MTPYLDLIRRVWRLREAQTNNTRSRTPKTLALLQYLQQQMDDLVTIVAEEEGLSLQAEPTEFYDDAEPE